MIIITAGLPGSGKSYFASRLAKKTGADYISSDKVRNTMGGRGKYTLKDKHAVYREMAKITETSLAQNRSVVVDATFSHKPLRELFYNIASKHALKPIFIRITAPEAVIKERLSKPREDSQADWKVYQLLRDQFEEITQPHLVLESTHNNSTQMLHKAITYIRDNHGRK